MVNLHTRTTALISYQCYNHTSFYNSLVSGNAESASSTKNNYNTVNTYELPLPTAASDSATPTQSCWCTVRASASDGKRKAEKFLLITHKRGKGQWGRGPACLSVCLSALMHSATRLSAIGRLGYFWLGRPLGFCFLAVGAVGASSATSRRLFGAAFSSLADAGAGDFLAGE